MLFAIPNGAKLAGTYLQRAKAWKRLEAEGAVKGAADLLLSVPSGALPENGDYLVYDADHSPKVVHEWEEWTYRDGSEIELRTAKVDLFDYLREYILSDYEDAGRVILSTFSMREDFNNYLSNF